LKSIVGFRSAAVSVFKVIVDLKDMFIWTSITTWMFALVGFHLYMGVSTQKCIKDFHEDASTGKEHDLRWHAWVSDTTNWLDPDWYIVESSVWVPKYGRCGNYSTTL